MALSLRLRRALTLSSSVLKDRRFSSISSSPPLLSPSKPRAPLIGNPSPRPHFLIQARSFRSSPVSFNRRFNDEKEIGPDDILFEGCDYNHWLITIDFPRDPETAPTRDQMIDTYVQTAAQVFGSVEEAKKRIYACSTTTYHGFQCICDEATSEKFRGLPGVVFILPDSYIDPVNKEYGGDKYENGVITPRPPPIAYGRQGRYGDRNRNYDQPRYNRPGSTQEGRSYGPPQQDGRNYSPPPQDGRGYAPPPQDGRNYSPPPQDGRGFAPPSQDGRGFAPPSQDGRGFGPPPQDGRGFGPPPQDGRGFGPPRQDGRGFGPPPQDGRGFGLPPQDGRGFGPPPQDGRGFGLPPQDGRGFGPPSQDWRGSGPPPQDGRGFGPPSQDGRGSGPPSQDGRGFGPPSQDGRGFGAPSQDRRGSAQGEQRDQMPPYQSGFHQGQQGNLSPQGNLSQGPAYAGDSRQGPGFDQGPSSNGPVEGQWQAKY